MNIVLRAVLVAGAFAFGYYLGREVTRGKLIGEQLKGSASTRVRGSKKRHPD